MKATEEPCDFTIDQQWRCFLERTGIEPEKFPPIQIEEMQKCFYAACGQMLMLMRDDFPKLDPQGAIVAGVAMVTEIKMYWNKKGQEYDRAQKQQGSGNSSSSTS